MNFKYVLYKTSNSVTGEYYIGLHKTRFEDDDYLGSGAKLKKAMLEHGCDKFKKETICVFDNRADAEVKEKELVKYCYGDPLCYNIRPGGGGGLVKRGWRNPVYPLRIKAAIVELGKDIKNARLRRRIQSKILAERASISRPTLNRIESGNPFVSIGAIACVLFSLGMIDRLAELVDIRADSVGIALQEEKLPKRIRYRKQAGPIENMYPFSGG